MSKVDPSNKNPDVFANVRELFQQEGCGICEKVGADKFWFNPYSSGAHEKCYEKIKKAESYLISVIHAMCPDFESYICSREAHIKAIIAIKAVCDGKTIKASLEKDGIDRITDLFNTVGIPAAKQYIDKQKSA